MSDFYFLFADNAPKLRTGVSKYSSSGALSISNFGDHGSIIAIYILSAGGTIILALIALVKTKTNQ